MQGRVQRLINEDIESDLHVHLPIANDTCTIARACLTLFLSFSTLPVCVYQIICLSMALSLSVWLSLSALSFRY